MSICAPPRRTSITESQADFLYREATISAFQKMCRDNFKRLAGYKENPELLEGGVYYANEYFYALKDAGLKTRLETFKNRHDFYNGHASVDHFEALKLSASVTGVAVDHWIIRKGVDPVEAMDALDRGPTLFSCGTAQNKTHFTALRTLLGDEKFNALFSSTSPTPLVISSNAAATPILFLAEKDQKNAPVKGDGVFFKGLDELYTVKHLNGEAKSYNTFALGNGKYVGFGLDPEGLTSDKVDEKLIEEYNRAPIGCEALPTELGLKVLNRMSKEHRRACFSLKDHEITRAEYYQRGGGTILMVNQRMSPKKIAALMNATTPEAVTLMGQWKRQANWACSEAE